MKKLLILFLLFPVLLKAQQTYWSVSPAGWPAISNPAFRFKANIPDSTNNLLIFNPLTGKYNQIYTATEGNKRFLKYSDTASLIQTIPNLYPKGDIRWLRKSDSTYYVTPWQLFHGNNGYYGVNNLHAPTYIVGSTLGIQPGANLGFVSSLSSTHGHWQWTSSDISPNTSSLEATFWNTSGTPVSGLKFLPDNNGSITDYTGVRFAKTTDIQADSIHSANTYRKKVDTITYGDKSRANILYIKGSSITQSYGKANINSPDSGYLRKTGLLLGIQTVNYGLNGRGVQGITSSDSSFYYTRDNIPNYPGGNSYFMLECNIIDPIGDSTIYKPSIYRVHLDSVIVAATTRHGWPANKLIMGNIAYYNPSGNPSYPNIPSRHAQYKHVVDSVAASRGILTYDGYDSFHALYNSDHSLLYADSLHLTGKGATVAANLFSSFVSTLINPVVNTANQTFVNIGAGNNYGNFSVGQNLKVGGDLLLPYGQIKIKNLNIGSGSNFVSIPDGAGGTIIPNIVSSSSNGPVSIGAALVDGTNDYAAGLSLTSSNATLAISSSLSGVKGFKIRSVGTDWLTISNAGNLTFPGTAKFGPAAVLTIPNGAGALTTPQLFESQSSGVAISGVGVGDGVNNFRTGFLADNTNSLVGIGISGSSSIPPFVIRSPSTEYLRILSTGNLGIGTSPSAKLHVLSTNEQLRLGNTSTQYLSFLVSSAGVATITPNGTSPSGILSGSWAVSSLNTAGVVHSTVTTGTLTTSQIVNTDIANSTIDLTTKVTGVLPLANGGRGVANTDYLPVNNPSATGLLKVTGTTEQFRLSYDASNYASFTVNSTGGLTITPTGTSAGSRLAGVWSISNGVALDGTLNLLPVSAIGSSGLAYQQIGATTGGGGYTYTFAPTIGSGRGPFDLIAATGPASKAYTMPQTSGTIALTTDFADAVNVATDANFTITSGQQFVELPVITANRTVSIPAASSYTGLTIRIGNKNTSGTFSWSFTGATVKDWAGNTLTTLVNTSSYILESDGTNWYKMN